MQVFSSSRGVCFCFVDTFVISRLIYVFGSISLQRFSTRSAASSAWASATASATASITIAIVDLFVMTNWYFTWPQVCQWGSGSSWTILDWVSPLGPIGPDVAWSLSARHVAMASFLGFCVMCVPDWFNKYTHTDSHSCTNCLRISYKYRLRAAFCISGVLSQSLVQCY